MHARTLLVRGLLAGLLAGLVTFAVAHQVGEPPLEAAIALESTAGGRSDAAGVPAHEHDHEETADHSHAEEDALVSRTVQRTVGLGLATALVGVGLGGLLGLAAAIAVGRLGRLTAAQSTAVVASVGFVALALVPFWRYPANPPAVGSAETIGSRTASHFGFAGLSLVVAVLCVVLAVRMAPRLGGYAATLVGLGGYLVVVLTIGSLMPPAADVGAYPAATLWEFRTASLVVLATLWGVLGAALTGTVGRVAAQTQRDLARRELAASL